jgi:DNA polymerase-3 subunit epsilon
VSLDFVAIDFETANRYRASACAIGLAKVENGQITDTFSALIKPHGKLYFVEGWNYKVHGISYDDLSNAKNIKELWPQIQEFIGNNPLVAHNASFDLDVLIKSLRFWGVDIPDLEGYCTYATAQTQLDLVSYKLPIVIEALEIPSFKHHDALADAVACAQIAIHFAADSRDIAKSLKRKITRRGNYISHAAQRGQVYAYEIPNLDQLDFDTAISLEGEVVLFTGTPATLDGKKEGQAWVRKLGGDFAENWVKGVTTLVCCTQDPKQLKSGEVVSSKRKKAEEKLALGGRIRIITEEEFLEFLPDWIATE